jgi:DinB family protein
MSTASSVKTTIQGRLDERLSSRIIEEGYGPVAWHGPNLKMALAEVTDELAFWRPSPGRHSIAEIALHHAYCTRSAGGQLSGTLAEPFVLEGDDWFELPGQTGLDWPKIQAVVDEEQRRLTILVADIATGRVKSPLEEAARFDLVLGITCHAVYHAGQVQLLKRLRAT